MGEALYRLPREDGAGIVAMILKVPALSGKGRCVSFLNYCDIHSLFN